MTRKQFRKRLEITERFRHLASFEIQQAAVNPKVCHRRKRHQRLALRDLIFVMRKDQICAAAVNVEAEPVRVEQRFRHRRTLDVPTGASVTVAVEAPARLSRLREFPKRKIERIFFVFANFNACAGFQFIDVAIAQHPVPWKGAHTVVDAVLRYICMTAFEQFANHRLNLRNVLRCIRFYIGLANAELAHRLFETPVVTHNDFVPVFARFTRAIDAAIVDVRDVLNVRDFVAPMREISAQQIEEEKRPRVPQVGFRRRCKSANVDTNVVTAQRLERFGLPSSRIIEL